MRHSPSSSSSIASRTQCSCVPLFIHPLPDTTPRALRPPILRHPLPSRPNPRQSDRFQRRPARSTTRKSIPVSRSNEQNRRGKSLPLILCSCRTSRSQRHATRRPTSHPALTRLCTPSHPLHPSALLIHYRPPPTPYRSSQVSRVPALERPNRPEKSLSLPSRSLLARKPPKNLPRTLPVRTTQGLSLLYCFTRARSSIQSYHLRAPLTFVRATLTPSCHARRLWGVGGTLNLVSGSSKPEIALPSGARAR